MEAPNKDRVDRVAREARQYRLSGSWGGGSFRYHPQGFIRRGLMVVSEHHVDNHCSVYAATEPDTEWTGARDHSASPGDPKPKPKTGDLIDVYWSGHWRKEGPWQQVLLDLLDEVEGEIEVAKEAERERIERERLEAQREREERDQELRRRWERSA